MAIVTVHCDGIVCDKEVEVSLPDGWVGETDTDDGGHWIYCSDHQAEKRFFSSVCPGCVESFKDCDLAESFMYAKRRIISPAHLNVIRHGQCPFRTNGTFSFTISTGLQSENISETADPKDGEFVAKAIEEYVEKYP